jgi:L-ascorbate metabolism protein UlaG (beta-lactamase superfamily)
MQLIGRIYEPDFAILPIGDHYTMGPREAAVALELLGVKRCIPCHYGTFPALHGTPEQLREFVDDVEVIAPAPGETLELAAVTA